MRPQEVEEANGSVIGLAVAVVIVTALRVQFMLWRIASGVCREEDRSPDKQQQTQDDACAIKTQTIAHSRSP